VFQGIMHKAQKPYGLFKKNNLVNECKWCATSLCCSVMMASVIGLYLWQHLNVPGQMFAGSIFLLYRYLDKISEVFFRFTGMYSTIVRQSAKVSNAELLAKDFRPEGMVNHVLPPDWKKLEVNNLSFSYHSKAGAELHLDDVSFSIRRGERIALIGASGGGKTTTLKLIRGLHPPRTLRLSVDGKEIPEGFDGISQAIALVPQAPEIFASTIRENITIGAEYPQELIDECVRMACFHRVLRKLPKGYESLTKERGASLSPGQNQRLALARGFVACSGKDIILLDEPTSSLDKANEALVYRNIFAKFRDKTVIASLHQLNLLDLFDQVYMFDKGKIVGKGTREELLKTCPEFQRLWGKYTRKAKRRKLKLQEA